MMNLYSQRYPCITLACVLVASGCSNQQPPRSSPATSVLARESANAPSREMAEAALRFVNSLSPELRKQTVFAFESKERQDWHFVPRQRPGVALGDLSDTQRVAARVLLRAALSSQGMLKTEAIMSLETVLREVEQAAGSTGSARDPLNYAISIFGTPDNLTPWGWRLEGHHICLNFTSVAGTLTAVTPAFWGSNPAEVKTGSKAGLRVLAMEEDLGRHLVHSLDELQRKTAIISNVAPPDVLTLPGRSLEEAIPDTQVGLSVAQMQPQQRECVERIILEFASNLRGELADHEIERIREAGIEKIRFAWAGGMEPGQGHYYRLSGPTFVIEYDNTQNNANHVHTIWHDRSHDLGGDLLKEHYEHDHPHK